MDLLIVIGGITYFYSTRKTRILRDQMVTWSAKTNMELGRHGLMI